MSDIDKKIREADRFARNGAAVQSMMYASMRAKKNKIAVLSPGGFSDNSKYIFAFLSNNIKKYRDDCEVFWLAHSAGEADLLNSFGVEAIHFKYDGPVLQKLIESKVCLRSTHHLGRVDYCMLQASLVGATNIQMWHGIPAKKVAYQLLKNRKNAWDFAYFAADCLANDYAIAESEYVAPRYQEAFPNASLLISGSPRTDMLFGDTPDNPLLYLNTNFSVLQSMMDFREQGGRVALYCPTFREAGQDRTSFLEGIRAFLTLTAKDPDIMVVVKNHRVSKDEDAIREIVNGLGSSRILMPAAADDIYPYLRETSVLVTDYSSSYYDFLLTGRDVVFFQPDREEYTDKRPIYDEEALSGFSLGPKTADGEAAYRAIKEEQSGDLKVNQETVCSKLFAHRDGKSCERLAEKIFNDLY